MATLPRLRQLRRDKTLFALALNTVRLHLEEEARTSQQPHLREAPDADLLFIQQSIDQWVSLAASYMVRKFHCPLASALSLIGELQTELKRGIPVEELWQIPLEQVLNLPPKLLQRQPETTPAESQQAADAE
ncbi:hypothetical protein HHL22_21075 [Hymenobacter sp. RP-2-7]|uniref:Uncharacterized protein n=1 Tax=Hymenobacter polaris TaxID=2682546 RepID=A0A7Y0AI21_9BACT|nr:hypothetical protein [Hymenobacter polaris]NML67702.1 hypothetical protein [Hymenobacter polaris]